jgi:hypothetical protein
MTAMEIEVLEGPCLAQARTGNNRRSYDFNSAGASSYAPILPSVPPRPEGRPLFLHAEARPKINEVPQLAAAMLAIALAAVMLVAGQLVIEKREVAPPQPR